MVEVFKTNVALACDADGLVLLLKECFPDSKISFDLEDCDKVLRIEGNNFAPYSVIKLVEERGYDCCALE